jgi:hypothetical protein
MDVHSVVVHEVDVHDMDVHDVGLCGVGANCVHGVDWPAVGEY